MFIPEETVIDGLYVNINLGRVEVSGIHPVTSKPSLYCQQLPAVVQQIVRKGSNDNAWPLTPTLTQKIIEKMVSEIVSKRFSFNTVFIF